MHDANVISIDLYRDLQGGTRIRLEFEGGVRPYDFAIKAGAPIVNSAKLIYNDEPTEDTPMYENVSEETQAIQLPAEDFSPIDITIPEWVPSDVVQNLIAYMAATKVPTEFYIRRHGGVEN